MNQLGVHALVWEAGWSHDECARAIGKTAELGYDFIEAPALDPGSIDPDFTRRQLEKNGVGINFSLGLDFDSDISSGDPEKGRRGKAKLEQAVAVCRDCGGEYVGGILHSAFGKYSRPTTAAGVTQSIDILRQVAETAAKSEITLVLEVVNRYKSNVLNTAAQGVDMCRRIGAPNVKVHLDVYHMNIEDWTSRPPSSRRAAILAISTPAIRIAATWDRAISTLRPCSAPWYGPATKGRSPSNRFRRAWSASPSKAYWGSGETCGRTATTSRPMLSCIRKRS